MEASEPGMIVLGLLCVFLLLAYAFWRKVWFFRNPARRIPWGEAILSPADGTVVYVERKAPGEPVISVKANREISISDIVREDLEGEKLLIGTFMSPLDVHYNRAPFSGTVEFIRHHPARTRNHHMTSMHWRSLMNRFPLYERSPHVIENERTVTKIQGRFKGELLNGYVVQIAGGSVRGIEAYVSEGDAVGRGEVFGMIRIGSQVDLVLPWRPSMQVRVQPGERVRAGESILVEYLERQGIFHALAHPLYAVNDLLTERHFCLCLLLFKTFEMNGARDEYQNRNLREILGSLTREDMLLLANRYDQVPVGEDPWIKNLIGGSDDHSSLHIGSCATVVEGAASVKEFLAGIRENRAFVSGGGASPKHLAQNLYSIAYQFYRHRLELERYVGKDLLLRFIDRALLAAPDQEGGFFKRIRGAIYSRRRTEAAGTGPSTLKDMLLKEGREIVLRDPQMQSLLRKRNADFGGIFPEGPDVWFRFVNAVSDKVLNRFADSILETLSGANVFDIFQGLGSAGSLYTLLSPYFVAYTLFTKDRRFSLRCYRHVKGHARHGEAEAMKVAHFTDTLQEINGVAFTLQMEAAVALKHDRFLRLITCGPGKATQPAVVYFPPVGSFALPEYPDLRQMDVVYVPSHATAGELEARGLAREKIRFFQRGIDTERFHASKRNGFFQKRFGLAAEDFRLLYVGRVSREKNLAFLAECFRRLHLTRKDLRLIVVGDGPYLQELKRVLEDLPATFTGSLFGEDLAQAYASSDLFVFPSTTDTFGNVVLEAQASGLPVIVTDEGGPQENLIHGKTGLVVPASDMEAFMQAILGLIDDPGAMVRMRRQAREYMKDRSFESAFLALWESYRDAGQDFRQRT